VRISFLSCLDISGIINLHVSGNYMIILSTKVGGLIMLKDIINSDSDNFWEWWSKPMVSADKEYRPSIVEVRNRATRRHNMQ